jgi:hypothetical protein
MSQLKNNIKAALKQNLVPGLALQALALTIALSYFYLPSTAVFFNSLADLKTSLGWKYAMVSTALFGGVIPFLYLLMSKQIGARVSSIFLFYLLFWAYKGIEIDLFYTLQAHWFGDGNDVATLIKKVAVDQLVYGTLWAAPTMAIGYLWKESKFNFGTLWQRVDRDFWLIQIPTTLVTNWLIWFPAVTIIYSMPSNLQIPLFNLVLCFFVLLLSAISKRHGDEAQAAA